MCGFFGDRYNAARAAQAEWAGGISPPASHRSGRDRLRSSGSCHASQAAACGRSRRAPPVAGWPCGVGRVTHPLRSMGVTPSQRYYEVVRPSPVHRYFRPRGATAWAFSLPSTGKVLTFCPEAQAGVMSPLRRTPPGQSTGSCQAAPRAYLRPWFWRRRCPFDASPGIRLRSSLQPPPDGCSRLFHDAHDRGF